MRLIFIMMFLIPFFSVSQDYQPMLVDGNFWDVDYYTQDSYFGCNEDPRRYVLGEVVLFMGKEYRKIYVHPINYEYEACPSGSMTSVSPAYYESEVYIREDVEEKKVYVYSDLIETEEGFVYDEYLLYDFNLEVGDQVMNPYIEDDTEVFITDLQIDDEGRKVYTTNIMNYTYVEGIGGASGIIAPFTYMFEYFDSLFCYGNIETNDNSCLYFLNHDEIETIKLDLFPNPIKNNLTVSSLIPVELSIESVYGEHVGRYYCQDVKQIDMSSLVSGIYFITATTHSGSKQTYKIIKL